MRLRLGHASYVTRAKEEGIVAHLMAIIPDSFFGSLARGDILQVLLVSILSGFAIARLGEVGRKINAAIDAAAKMFFGIIRIIVRVAPLGAFGAMAFTVGAYGLGSLLNLAAAAERLDPRRRDRAADVRVHSGLLSVKSIWGEDGLRGAITHRENGACCRP